MRGGIRIGPARIVVLDFGGLIEQRQREDRKEFRPGGAFDRQIVAKGKELLYFGDESVVQAILLVPLFFGERVAVGQFGETIPGVFHRLGVRQQAINQENQVIELVAGAVA